MDLLEAGGDLVVIIGGHAESAVIGDPEGRGALAFGELLADFDPFLEWRPVGDLEVGGVVVEAGNG